MNTTSTLNTTSALKFKLYRHQRNALLHKRIDIAGCIWNHCIALHRRYYRLAGKHLNQFDLMRHLTRLKKLSRFTFWNELGSQAIQDIAQRIDRAYRLFFRNLKQGTKTSPPKFRKVKKYRSFTLKQAGWKLLGGNKVRIQGYVYKFCQSRDIIGSVKTVTVKRDTLGELWVIFVVENQVEVPNRTGNIAVGFDFGLKIFLTASDGSTMHPQSTSSDHLRNCVRPVEIYLGGSGTQRTGIKRRSR
jgi:putative transposase